jgi:hypothetical protein
MTKQPQSILFFICLSVIALRCSEIYDPQLDNAEDILVVEARMTDDTGTYYVKLSLTSPFNRSTATNPVSGVNVWVRDNNDGSIDHYTETGSGQYTFKPDTNETGDPGHSYVLHIETSEGDIFESFPEVMSSPSQIDSVYGIKKTRAELTESPDGSSPKYKNRSYLDIISDIQSNTDSIPRVRFEPGWIYEMIDYHREVTGGPPVPPTFSWSYTQEASINITDAAQNYVLKEQKAGSLLLDNLPGFYEDQNLQYIVLIMDFYNLNEDSYNFYNGVKKQLSADNALFDPIASQIEGNIYNVNNSGRQVAGLFDVASHKVAAFFVNPNGAGSTATIREVQNFHSLPSTSEGKTEGIPPEWWFD